MRKRLIVLLSVLLLFALPVSAESDVEFPETIEYDEQGRKNPCPIGKAIYYACSANDVDFEVKLWVESVLRGSEAEEAAKKGNPYNSLPENGEEMIIVFFHAAVTWASDENAKLPFTQGRVVGVTKKGRELPKKYLAGTVAGIENELAL